MARVLFFVVAVLLFGFGLGYLGASRQNSGLMVLGAIFFILALASGNRLGSKSKTRELSGAGIEHLQDLLVQGKKLEAIKRYRDLTQSSLKEAKGFIEALAGQQNQDNLSQGLPLPLSPELEEALRTIKKQSPIEAIRELKALTGLSLREAKDYIDSL